MYFDTIHLKFGIYVNFLYTLRPYAYYIKKASCDNIASLAIFGLIFNYFKYLHLGNREAVKRS